MTRNTNFTWDGIPVEHLTLPRAQVRKGQHKQRVGVEETTRTCTSCELRAKCKSPVPPLYPEHPISAFAVVATAPTPLDDRKGRPFVSRGGQVLRKSAIDVGVDVDAGTWLNVVACASDSPEPEHIDACRGNLLWGLRAANTRYVLLAGAVALGAWHEGLTVTRTRGQWFIWWDEGDEGRGWWVMPTYHPAAILKQPSLRGELREDLAKFADVVVNHRTPTPSVKCVVCGDPQTHWDTSGVGWCDGCWATRLKNRAVIVGRGRRKVHPDQAAFKF